MTKEVEELILDKIRCRYSDNQQTNPLTAETMLRDLALDSLSLLELIYELEEHYHIIVDDEQLLNLKTVADIGRMVCAAMKSRNPA
ncbi:MAG: phosphopantetheine-binding protein [Pseudohongiellaceae bacterium]